MLLVETDTLILFLKFSKKNSEFWQEILSRVVQTATYITKGTFCVKKNLLTNLLTLLASLN